MLEGMSTYSLRGQLAGLAQTRPSDDPEIVERRQELLARRLLKQVQQNASALSNEQRTRILLALNPAA